MSGTLVLGVAAWLASGVSPAVQKTKGPSDPARVQRVQPAELQKMIARNEAVLVDVRSAQAFATGHLDGAISIPAAEIESRAGEIRRRAGSRTVVMYCSCAFEHTAADAAVKLARLGVARVAVLAGGYFPRA